jgi:cytochrome c peroxidase
MQKFGSRFSRRRAATAAFIGFAVLTLAQIAGLYAQRSSSSIYGGSGPGWWTAGLNAVLPRQDDYTDSTGQVRLVIPAGSVLARENPFFEALGSNGRACITCHQPSNGMSVSAEGLRERWSETGGKDAVFAAVDGSNCPDLPQDEMRSHSLLLDRGLFRIVLPWPPHNADGSDLTPEFRIEVVNDPTGCNTSAVYGLKNKQHPAISVFRRPRVTANLLRSVLAGPEGLALMADGRETTLRGQALSAAAAHEEANTPTERQLLQIVELETRLYVAQGSDVRAGLLNEDNGPLILGPENLADGRVSRPGPGNKPANTVWASFDSWRMPPGARELGDLQLEFRESVARGSDVFFGHTFRIPEVSDGTRTLGGEVTCSACHSGRAPRWMDIGTADVAEGKQSSDLPVFRIACDTSATPPQYRGRVIYTQDPGRALISGKCADAGAFVMQQFHGLSARAPYFANGSAATLGEVVDFYERRFHLGLTPAERTDLLNFLRVL